MLRRSRPILALHVWHEDVCAKLLEAVPFPSCWGGLKLVVPDNLDPRAAGRIRAIASASGFASVTEVAAPAAGRDIGGLVTILLQACPESSPDQTVPHLFLHSKRSAHLPALISECWRENLVSRVAQGAGLPRALFALSAGGAGIVYSREARRVEHGDASGSLPSLSAAMADRLSLELFRSSPGSYAFCAGTMMWFVPSKIAACWTKERLQRVLELLEPSRDLSEPSHAHAFERLFPEAASRAGIRVAAI
jgi:hypothetical protein